VSHVCVGVLTGVALVLGGALRNARFRALRWWAAGLTAAYATPLVLWAIGPDRAPSLSKDMDPVFAALIVAASVAFIAAYYVIRTRSLSLSDRNEASA
jgi:bacteriorhodopsin